MTEFEVKLTQTESPRLNSRLSSVS